MKVVICGAGQVGFGIAERLSREQNDVTVIDSSPRLVAAIRDTLDVRGVVGHAAHPEILEQAGANDCDMLIAVTLYDEVNMVSCQVAHSMFSVPTKVARVRAQSYLQPRWRDLFTRNHMPIDVIISPEIEVGDTVLRRLALPGANDTVLFADDKAVMVAIQCDDNCPIVDTPLRQLTELFPDLPARVVGIDREGQIFAPDSDDQLLSGDTAYVIVERGQVRRTLGIFGHEEAEATRIIIAGGGNIGLYVAKYLEERNSGAKVKIIEPSRERAEHVADSLRRTVVLHGSALDQEILTEAGAQDADTMVSLTNDDKVNVLSSVMAKRLGCKSNLALLNDSAYHPFARTLGIDAHINPRAVTISRVLRHVRRGRIRGVHSIQNGAAEVIEAEALDTSPLVGKPLRSLELPEGIRIGALVRKGQVIIPSGDTKVSSGDRVVIFAVSSQVRRVEQLFRVSLEFF